MKQHNDVITFEVNETLYFENGQEIDEMLSISLDPEIAIQTYDNYIQIRGLILLQGEYIKTQEQGNEQQNVFNDDLTGYIEKVVDTGESQAKFSHRFPVDISVPPYRVKNIEDVTVSIDSFDYELPDQGKLKIKSTIHINGIQSDATIEDERVRSGFDNIKENHNEKKEDVRFQRSEAMGIEKSV